MFTFVSWKIVIIATFKSLIIPTSGHLRLVFCWLLILLSIGQIILVFCMLNNFGLYPGGFEYCADRLWVLLNSQCFFLLLFKQAIKPSYIQITSSELFLMVVFPRSVWILSPCCAFRISLAHMPLGVSLGLAQRFLW